MSIYILHAVDCMDVSTICFLKFQKMKRAVSAQIGPMDAPKGDIVRGAWSGKPHQPPSLRKHGWVASWT